MNHMFTLAACAVALMGQNGLDHSKATLISQVTSFKPGASFWVGVQFKMTPGWHIYWRNPGDSGMEVRVKWNLPKGWKAQPLRWPAPEAIVDGDIVNYGYNGETILLASLSAPAGAKATTIKADLNWLTCDDEMCLPAKQSITLKIGSSKQPIVNAANLTKFASAMGKTPQGEITEGAATLTGREIRMNLNVGNGVRSVAFYPYDASVVGSGRYEANAVDGRVSFTLKRR